jgi:hypothetical protein
MNILHSAIWHKRPTHLPQRSQSTQRIWRGVPVRQHNKWSCQAPGKIAFAFLCDLCVLCGLNPGFVFASGKQL